MNEQAKLTIRQIILRTQQVIPSYNKPTKGKAFIERIRTPKVNRDAKRG